ncbi:hypothetical protein PWY87_33195 [Kribbella solani]|uniref:hypothetical protein n=1 Tax=Kribbella solani TaxID=236067 RepID=UPI0029A1A273|nr:hypothetical protein [Kribbella solani]MDX3006579.1 hypothetical protein [Kribbella solani]
MSATPVDRCHDINAYVALSSSTAANTNNPPYISVSLVRIVVRFTGSPVMNSQ